MPDNAPIALPNPPAGQSFRYRPGGAVETVLVAVCFQVVTSAAVAARIPTLDFLDPLGGIVARVQAPFTLAATHTSFVTFGVGLQQYGANNAAALGAGIPTVRLIAGMAVRGSLAAVDGADQISLVRGYVRQYVSTAEPV